MKTGKSKTIIVDTGVFAQQVMFHFGEKQDLVDELTEYFGESDVIAITDAMQDSDSTVLGKTLSLPKGTLIYMPHTPVSAEDVGVLEHEILHAVFFITKEIGIEYSSESEEVYTYLLEYLTQSVLEELQKTDWKSNECVT